MTKRKTATWDDVRNRVTAMLEEDEIAHDWIMNNAEQEIANSKARIESWKKSLEGEGE